LYKGQWHKETCKPHGKGIMVMRSGHLYEGYFRDGLPFGLGIKITHNYCLEGYFVGFENRADVKITFRDLSVFIGKLSFHEDVQTGTLS
jgi:hypothetical protein